MNAQKKIQKLEALALPSDLAKKAVDAGYTLTSLRTTPLYVLKVQFDDADAKALYDAGRRKPIPIATIERLIRECDFKCCVCYNFDSERPVVIHHIEEHATKQDDSYENLVVLCLEHHGTAHTSCSIGRDSLSENNAMLMKQKKAEWISALSDFKAGLRPAPGREFIDVPSAHSDKQFLQHLRGFLNRKAMRQPFEVEGSMSDFRETMSKITLALNTGIMKTREGDIVAHTKTGHNLSNSDWQERLNKIISLVEEIENRYDNALRNGELTITSNGRYYFRSSDISRGMDTLRENVNDEFNDLLRLAGLLPINSLK